jgi:hypothetical protein
VYDGSTVKAVGIADTTDSGVRFTQSVQNEINVLENALTNPGSNATASAAKLHDQMVAGLHDALALTNNDTPLLYDSHDVLFRHAMASFGTNDLSTAHDTLLPKQHQLGFHELAANDTHTLASTRAASSADTILAVPHHV